MLWTPEKIRALREHHEMTQQSLAQSLGVSLTVISRWENGKHTLECSAPPWAMAQMEGE